MRAKIHSILIGTVACAHLGAVPALAAAHPTHTLNRESRRLVIPAPSHQVARGHAARHPAEHSTAHRHSATASHHTAAATHETASAHHASTHHRHVEKAADHGDLASRHTADAVHAWERTQHEAAAPAATDASENTPAQPTLAGTITASSPELPRVPSIEQEASTPVILPSLYDKRGRLVMPPPLYGSHEILVHQNMMAEHDGLSRVRDDQDLMDLRRERKLVALPEGETLHVDDRLPEDRRFSRPWTAAFLSVLGRDFYNRFHEPLQVNSAVRTVEIQEHLLHVNGNAAPASGETASPHLTGQAIDIGKRGLSQPEIAWMRAYLEPLMEQGKIDVEEEFQQSCFHISVYKAYQQSTHMSLAATQALSGPASN